jgi:hypothetical protein
MSAKIRLFLQNRWRAIRQLEIQSNEKTECLVLGDGDGCATRLGARQVCLATVSPEEMKMFKTLAALVIVAGSIAITEPAHAFQPGERCLVKKTGDGFVALRKGPTVKSKRVRKLKRNTDNVFPMKLSKGWAFVDAASYDSNYAEDDPRHVSWFGKGFLRADLIDWASCNNAG